MFISSFPFHLISQMKKLRLGVWGARGSPEFIWHLVGEFQIQIQIFLLPVWFNTVLLLTVLPLGLCWAPSATVNGYYDEINLVPWLQVTFYWPFWFFVATSEATSVNWVQINQLSPPNFALLTLEKEKGEVFLDKRTKLYTFGRFS